MTDIPTTENTMIKKILTAVAVTLTAVFLLFCGASSDPAVTAHNTYNAPSAESEEGSADTSDIETSSPADTVRPAETPPAETVTDAVTETATETDAPVPEETAAAVEDTVTEPEEIPVTDGALPETEASQTDAPVTEEKVTEAVLTFDPPVKELPPLTMSAGIDPAKPMIALTFDDGPSAHTDRLLDIFKEYGGKGTFFLVGGHVDYRPDTVKRIAAEGHEIGGHSVDHPQLTKLSSEDVAYQLSWTRDKICEVTGVDSYLVRPPYGAYDDEVQRIAAGLGIAFINWSVDTLDWKYKNAETVHDKIMSDVFDGAVILCHDIHKTTVDAMETVIPELLDMGYQLVTVSDLLSVKNEMLTAGAVYNRR